MAKHLTRTQSDSSIVAFLTLFATLTLLPLALLVWRTPSLVELFWLLVTAVFATGAHYTMSLSFRAAEITAVQPVIFLQLIWATLLGLIMFGEQPDIWIWIGGGIIVATATLTAQKEARLKVISTNTKS